MHSSEKPLYNTSMSSRNAQLRKQADRLTRRALAYLYWEQYAPVFALAALFLSLFMIGSFSGLWQWIGDPWRLVFLLIAAYFLVKAILKARQFKRPNRSAAKRRVEYDSGAAHRPLDTIEDRPALSADGWDQHYQKAEDKVATLSKPQLRPVLGAIDKYFLRFITPVAIILSVMIGTSQSFERLRHALTPGWISGAIGDDVTFEAWIDPPAYTGRPPIYFKNTDKVEVPEGSELVARIIGTKNPTRLRLTGQRGSRSLKLNRIGPDSFEARAIVKSPSTASWRIGQNRKDWRIKTLADQPPAVAFVRAPKADKRDRLTFGYSLNDDYGVESLSLELRLLQDDPNASELTRSVDVPLGGNNRKAEDETAALNLTQHEWAGKKVAATLLAKDGLGQLAKSDDVYFTVPNKIFIEPLAKAVVEHRSLVMAGQAEYAAMPRLTRKDWHNRPWFDTWQPEFRMERAPESIQRAALMIDIVTDRPESLFSDPAVYIGLRNVASRLRYAREQGELDGLPEDLWNIAIRAEFGTLGSALEEMREAQAALRDGIARRAPQREIDTLFDRYNEAVERYREELVRQAIEDGNMAESEGGGGDGSGFNVDEIQALLDAIEEANRIGDSEGARRALAQLAQLLENMEIQLTEGGGGSGGQSMPGEMSEEMRESLEELADLLGEQRELRDETQQSQQAENEGSTPGNDDNSETEAGEESDGSDGGEQDADQNPLSGDQLAEQQQRLQDLLDKAQNALPEPGEGDGSGGSSEENGEEDGAGGVDPEQALEDAQRAMELAEDALRRGQFGDAQDEQANAIEAIRNAGRALAEQSRQNRGDNQEASNEGDDPLGRTSDSENNNGENIEDELADLDSRDRATRSRELQEEIRRRAAEQERQKDEREYLERLLKRF